MLDEIKMLHTLAKLFLRINSNVSMVHLIQHLLSLLHYCAIRFHFNATLIVCLC